MPAKEETSGILVSLGSQVVEAFDAGKNKPVELSFGGNLPGGIENGVAQLRDLRIGKYQDGTKLAGKPYFMGQAVVMFPKEIKGQKLVGLYTKIGPEPLTATPDRQGDKSRKTFAEHFDWMLQHLMQLGANLGGLQGKTPLEVENHLRLVMKALCKAAPYFRFRTWVGTKQVIAQDTDGRWYLFNENEKGSRKRTPAKPGFATEEAAKKSFTYAGNEPQVQHVWGEIIHDYRSAIGNGMKDESEPQEGYSPSNRISEPLDKSELSSAADEKANKESSADQFNEFSDSGDNSGHLDGLVMRATEQEDEQAQDELIQMAVAAGYDESFVTSDKVQSWASLAEMIRNPQTGSEEAELASSDESSSDAESEPTPLATPAVKDVVHFNPIDPKTKKPAKKAVECEVISVDKKAKTVKLKLLRDGKTIFNAVPWDKIAS